MGCSSTETSKSISLLTLTANELLKVAPQRDSMQSQLHSTQGCYRNNTMLHKSIVWMQTYWLICKTHFWEWYRAILFVPLQVIWSYFLNKVMLALPNMQVKSLFLINTYRDRGLSFIALLIFIHSENAGSESLPTFTWLYRYGSRRPQTNSLNDVSILRSKKMNKYILVFVSLIFILQAQTFHTLISISTIGRLKTSSLKPNMGI